MASRERLESMQISGDRSNTATFLFIWKWNFHEFSMSFCHICQVCSPSRAWFPGGSSYHQRKVCSLLACLTRWWYWQSEICQKSSYRLWLMAAVFFVESHRFDRAQMLIWTTRLRWAWISLRRYCVRLHRRRFSIQIYTLRRLAVRKGTNKENSTMTFMLLKILPRFMYESGKILKRKGKFIAFGHVKEKFYELRQEWRESLLLCFPFAVFYFWKV